MWNDPGPRSAASDPIARTAKIALFAAVTLFGISAVYAQKVGTQAAPSFEKFLQQQLKAAGQPVAIAVKNGEPLVAPVKPPFAWPMEKLPDNHPKVQAYTESLRKHVEAQQLLKQVEGDYRRTLAGETRLKFFSGTNKLPRMTYMAQRIAQWNGDIFWAPASKETDANLRHADEIRSVFGPIPSFNVSQLGVVQAENGYQGRIASLFVEVDGNRVELKPNTGKPGNPLEFEHRDSAGTLVKRTASIEKCDKPSLAGGVTPCGTASRVGKYERGTVEWLLLARKAIAVAPLSADRYWLQGNPEYALLGYIGFNRATGEVAFFDGAPGQTFTWDAPTVAPGGRGYGDTAGRAIAARTYDSAFRVDCAACHDNKEPRIVTPYIKQARVGYRDAAAQAAFSLGDLLPEALRGAKSPYRVVGTGYNLAHGGTIDDGRIIKDPSGTCTACHNLTNLNTARFASDSVGRLGSLPADPAEENAYRTDWALRSGAGKIHPWMLPPPRGNDLSTDPQGAELSDAQWTALRALLIQPPADSVPIFTSAPAPESVLMDSTRLADPFVPDNFALAIAGNRDGAGQLMDREVLLSWTYLNGLGGVPERDDVRFNIAIREADIPASGAEPAPTDYPTLEDVKGLGASELAAGLFTDGRNLLVKDLSYAGHVRWMDAAPTTAARPYRLAFPAATGRRYLIRVSAKRHTFDRAGELFSDKDHLFFVDVQ